MKTLGRHLPLLIWAARDVQRRPGRTLLAAACLAALVFLATTIMLFGHALDATWGRLMVGAPDLVIRRVDAGGWAPLPIAEGVARAGTVAGVVRATPRLWGVVPGPDGPLTVVASPAAVPEAVVKAMQPPRPGYAVVGAKVMVSGADNRLTLGDRHPLTVSVVDTFPETTALATHDLVWLHAHDLRRLLDVAADQASDLAIWLSRQEEVEAIQPELAAAFPWPVRITDRSSSRLRTHLRAVRVGSLALVAGIPALLGLLFTVTGVAAGGGARRPYWGLLRAMGWTSGDLIRLQMIKALVTATPAVAVGLAAAYAVVFYPPTAGITGFWLSGGEHLPALTLTSSGAAGIMLAIATVVAMPYLAAVFLTSLRGVTDDPWAMLQADPWN